MVCVGLKTVTSTEKTTTPFIHTSLTLVYVSSVGRPLHHPPQDGWSGGRQEGASVLPPPGPGSEPDGKGDVRVDHTVDTPRLSRNEEVTRTEPGPKPLVLRDSVREGCEPSMTPSTRGSELGKERKGWTETEWR